MNKGYCEPNDFDQIQDKAVEVQANQDEIEDNQEFLLKCLIN